jgi:hypothetical protein
VLADAKAKPASTKLATSLRIEPEMLLQLKALALQKRIRVNDLILEAIENYLALHGKRAA